VDESALSAIEQYSAGEGVLSGRLMLTHRAQLLVLGGKNVEKLLSFLW
jgi:hypothetical protein